jgi:hypothetical protein
MGPIRIKGTDMSTLNQLDLVIEPTLLQTLETIPVSLIMAEYRQKVVKVLNLLRTATATLLIRGEESIKAEAEALLKQIQDDDRIRTHPLKPMLIEDLEYALRLSRRGHPMTQNETVEMAQHSAYLGMARGLRTVTSQVPPPAPYPRVRRSGRIQRQMAVASLAPDEVGADPALSPPQSPALAPMMTSPFANRIQTQMASVMRTMSSQDPDSQAHP